MKKRLIAALTATVLFATTLSGCNGANTTEDNKVQNNNTQNSVESKQEILEDAFMFCLPLLVMDATATKSTNTVEVTGEQAPENQLFHATNLVDASFKDVVTPNVDTIYSQAFLNLESDAVIMQFPKTERFCTVEIMDAYSNCITVLDASAFENEVETFILTGTNFEEAIPEGMQELKSPTSRVWVLIRTLCNNQNDLENVYAIQNQMDCYTYSMYQAGTTKEQPKGTFKEENNYVPIEHLQTMSMDTFFNTANALMVKNPPAKEDQEMLDKMAEIQVGPGLTFDANIFGEEADNIWKELMKNAINLTLQGSSQYMVKNGCWSFFGEPIAEFGTAYAYRALIALAGFGANPVSTAVYPKAEYDSDGERLTGTNQYVLHFEKDQLPPVKDQGFWSVTAYDSSNNFLIDNELDRYCINDRSEVQYNEDGSLDIYVQKEKPEEDKVSNWLPVNDGEFHLFLRIYSPTDTVLNGEWNAPTIKK